MGCDCLLKVDNGYSRNIEIGGGKGREKNKCTASLVCYFKNLDTTKTVIFNLASRTTHPGILERKMLKRELSFFVSLL